MSLGGFISVLLRLFLMPTRRLGMMSCLFMISGIVAFGGGSMMFSGLRMVLRSFAVVLCSFFRHRIESPWFNSGPFGPASFKHTNIHLRWQTSPECG